jgi:hypothetical protein
VRLPIVRQLGPELAGIIVIGRADIDSNGPSVGRAPTAIVTSTAGLVENRTLLKFV